MDSGNTPDNNARLGAALAAVGVPWDEVIDCQELGGGTFNTVFRVRRVGDTQLVVKLAPDRADPILRYEQGILSTEALFYKKAGAETAVPVPTVLHTAGGNGHAAGDHLVMSACAGTSWYELADQIDGTEQRLLRAALGRHVAALHGIVGEAFGYPAKPLGPLRTSWRVAFLEMVDGVLADADRFGVPLPRATDEIRELFARQEALSGPVITGETVEQVLGHAAPGSARDFGDTTVCGETGARSVTNREARVVEPHLT